ncbi:MAG: GSCFA domain-containing protein [Verrucomicrobiae bacterium]
MKYTCPTDFLCNAQWLKPLEMPVNREIILTSFDQKFVGFGSCFAQNLKGQLERFQFEFYWNRDICAHYATNSLLQTLRRATGAEEHMDDELMKVKDNPEDIVLINYFKLRFFGPSAREKAIATRISLDAELIDKIKDGDIFVVTLGNSRVFTPKEGKTIACNFYGLSSNDFCNRQQSVEEVENDLNEILNIVLKIRNGRELKLITTISPQRYFYDPSTLDCSTLENNCIMKSTLRVAVDRFAKTRKNDGAVYFPAYEMVIDELRLYETLSGYDHMHINQEFTPPYVVKKFLKNHASDDVLENLSVIEGFNELVQETNLDISRGASSKHPDIVAAWMGYFERLLKASQDIVPHKTWFFALDALGKLDLLDELKALCSKRILSPAVEKVISDWSHHVTK